MKIYNELIIFGYFLCLIFLTMILFSFVFNSISKRLFGTDPEKTKLYYFEMILIWAILASLIFYYKKNINEYNKKKITGYIKSNGENGTYEDIHFEINNLEKFDIVIILGFIIIFSFSQNHTFNEKLKLLNEDIGIIADSI
jgi:tryptophan-rich sensory protein